MIQEVDRHMIKTTIDIQTHSKPNYSNIKINPPWNFKKANWENYNNQLEKEMQHVLVEEHQKPDKIYNLFYKTILKTAKENIPRGRVTQYKPFWSKTLSHLKTKRNEARIKAEKTANPIEIQEWRKIGAAFRKELSKSKKNSFHNFLENLDFRKDRNKAYSVLASLISK